MSDDPTRSDSVTISALSMQGIQQALKDAQPAIDERIRELLADRRTMKNISFAAAYGSPFPKLTGPEVPGQEPQPAPTAGPDPLLLFFRMLRLQGFPVTFDGMVIRSPNGGRVVRDMAEPYLLVRRTFQSPFLWQPEEFLFRADVVVGHPTAVEYLGLGPEPEITVGIDWAALEKRVVDDLKNYTEKDSKITARLFWRDAPAPTPALAGSIVMDIE